MAGRATPATTAAERAKVTHRIHEYDHDPSGGSYGEEAARALDVDPARVLKTLLAETDDGRLVVGIVPVMARLDLKALAKAVGAKKAAMADASDAERATGYVTGGISPLGQRKRLPTVLDARALAYGTVFVSGGRRGLEIELAPQDLVRLTSATTAAIAAG